MTMNEAWKKGDPIVYKKEKAEPFDYIPPGGRRREAVVPDTIDLSEMARLCVNAMTEATDPDADYEMYFELGMRGKTPVMSHSMADMCIMKFQEGLPLLRLICGSTQNEHVERAWMETTLKAIGDDGHIYECLQGKPWWRNGNVYDSASGGAADSNFTIDPAYSGRFLSAMTLYYKRSGNEIWKTAALRLVDALIDCAVDKGDYAYFSPSPYLSLKGSTEDYGSASPQVGTEVRHPFLGCLHVYREFQYAPALAFAGKLQNYMLERMGCVGEDGRFLGFASSNMIATGKFMGTEAHFHTHTSILHYALEYALISGDHKYLSRILKGYEYAKRNGQTTLGYFSEFLHSAEFEHHEACELADMIAIAVKLSDAGIRDCWNDVDLWLRNMGVEGQLTPDKAFMINTYAEKKPDGAPCECECSYDRPVERNIGAFAGWVTPNDFFDPGGGSLVMHCCTGNMARALYYAWKSAVAFRDGKLKVNLLMNMETPDAEIISYIPYTGRVEIRPKKSGELWLRLPDWARAETAEITVNGIPLSVKAEGTYVVVSAAAGDEVILNMPITETKTAILVEKRRYTITLRGNDVVDIKPRGDFCPLFNRSRYGGGEAAYRTVTRFVTDEDIYW
ncbi:MAG: glycoside hydrolase family 127 protein [Oscillospiraceae bacterium]|jgi:hypothetical protein|nr:glycoside hydrolase family 127 protein [Oscillospiraceae bacterium]